MVKNEIDDGKAHGPWGTYKECPYYNSVDDCWNDRHNHQELWRDIILHYNGSSKCRLYREMAEAGNDIFDGIRCPEELRACMKRGVFDAAVWVSRHVPRDPSNGITRDMCDYEVNNHHGVDFLHGELLRLVTHMRDDGYDVEMKERVADECLLSLS